MSKSGRVVVVGLGPGDPGLLSAAAARELKRPLPRFVRTRRHPSAGVAEPASSFDGLYESAPTIEAVYAGIVDALVEAAVEHGEVLYAVPGSPLVAERSVELLRRDGRVEVAVVLSMSFLDLAWEALGIDPLQEGVRLVDGHRFAIEAAGESGPMLVAQCDSRLVLSEIKLAVEEGPQVTVLQRLGTAGQLVDRVAWADLDRSVEPDHLTCLWIPGLAEPVAGEVARFDALVRTLRERCPWDARQTHQSLTRHLLEEAYEVLEAIDELDVDPSGYEHLEEELGDLLFQVAFHANLAREAGQFGLADVVRTVHDKLVDRHPHVFGPPGHPVPDWEATKRREKGRTSAMEGIPEALPGLLYAFKVQARATSTGFGPVDPDPAGTARRAIEALCLGAGARSEAGEQVGQALFALVELSRRQGVDPESALRRAAARFRSRFLAEERLAGEDGRSSEALR